jgi:hypothetical protein
MAEAVKRCLQCDVRRHLRAVSAPTLALHRSGDRFTDIVSSTEQAARMGHRRWSALSDTHDAMVRRALERHRGREIKTIGDGFLATFDATSPAIRAAIEIVQHAKAMGIEVRAGVHTGEVEMRPADVTGLAVNITQAGLRPGRTSRGARVRVGDTSDRWLDHRLRGSK